MAPFLFRFPFRCQATLHFLSPTFFASKKQRDIFAEHLLSQPQTSGPPAANFVNEIERSLENDGERIAPINFVGFA